MLYERIAKLKFEDNRISKKNQFSFSFSAIKIVRGNKMTFIAATKIQLQFAYDAFTLGCITTHLILTGKISLEYLKYIRPNMIFRNSM